MYETAKAATDSSAFRKAEKKYKLYKSNSSKKRANQQPKPVGLSDVVDFKQLLQPETLPPGIFKLQSNFDFPVFGFQDRPADMLGGHLDDMEADWSKPIVSISLGCKAIFLLGGMSREDFPTAMFLQSGDVVLMAGQARQSFHDFSASPSLRPT